jgi:hypothetical protein
MAEVAEVTCCRGLAYARAVALPTDGSPPPPRNAAASTPRSARTRVAIWSPSNEFPSQVPTNSLVKPERCCFYKAKVCHDNKLETQPDSALTIQHL